MSADPFRSDLTTDFNSRVVSLKLSSALLCAEIDTIWAAT